MNIKKTVVVSCRFLNFIFETNQNKTKLAMNFKLFSDEKILSIDFCTGFSNKSESKQAAL
jgi:hypothetical protein